MLLDAHVVVVELEGNFESGALDTVKSSIAELLESSGAAHIFFDAEHLSSYDSVVRDELVQLFRTNRSKWVGLHVLFRSVLVGMTVSAVGLVLGRALKGHRERSSFEAAVEAALAGSA